VSEIDWMGIGILVFAGLMLAISVGVFDDNRLDL
jgi:hypothetical protein